MLISRAGVDAQSLTYSDLRAFEGCGVLLDGDCGGCRGCGGKREVDCNLVSCLCLRAVQALMRWRRQQQQQQDAQP